MKSDIRLQIEYFNDKLHLVFTVKGMDENAFLKGMEAELFLIWRQGHCGPSLKRSARQKRPLHNLSQLAVFGRLFYQVVTKRFSLAVIG